MNGLSAPRKSDWLAPANMLALLGMLGMAFSSYMTFQTDTRDRVASLEYRMKTLELQGADIHQEASANAEFRERVTTDLALLKQERRR